LALNNECSQILRKREIPGAASFTIFGLGKEDATKGKSHSQAVTEEAEAIAATATTPTTSTTTLTASLLAHQETPTASPSSTLASSPSCEGTYRHVQNPIESHVQGWGRGPEISNFGPRIPEFSNFGPGIPEFSNFGTDLQGVSNRDAPSANVGSRMAGQISKSSSNSSSIATLPPFPDSSESNDNRNKIHADIHEQVSQIDEIDVGSAKKQITVDVGSDDKHIKIDEQHMNIGNFEGKRDRKWRAVLERSEHSTHELAAVDLAAPVSDRERALRASIGLAIQKMSFEHVELDISGFPIRDKGLNGTYLPVCVEPETTYRNAEGHATIKLNLTSERWELITHSDALPAVRAYAVVGGLSEAQNLADRGRSLKSPFEPPSSGWYICIGSSSQDADGPATPRTNFPSHGFAGSTSTGRGYPTTATTTAATAAQAAATTTTNTARKAALADNSKKPAGAVLSKEVRVEVKNGDLLERLLQNWPSGRTLIGWSQNLLGKALDELELLPKIFADICKTQRITLQDLEKAFVGQFVSDLSFPSRAALLAVHPTAKLPTEPLGEVKIAPSRISKDDAAVKTSQKVRTAKFVELLDGSVLVRWADRAPSTGGAGAGAGVATTTAAATTAAAAAATTSPSSLNMPFRIATLAQHKGARPMQVAVQEHQQQQQQQQQQQRQQQQQQQRQPPVWARGKEIQRWREAVEMGDDGISEGFLWPTSLSERVLALRVLRRVAWTPDMTFAFPSTVRQQVEALDGLGDALEMPIFGFFRAFVLPFVVDPWEERGANTSIAVGMTLECLDPKSSRWVKTTVSRFEPLTKSLQVRSRPGVWLPPSTQACHLRLPKTKSP